MKDKDQLLKHYLSEYFLSHKKINKSSIQGFTLIELIVVFIIIGILSAVSLPAYLGQIGKSREVEILATIGSIARTQQSYHFMQGKFATTMATIEADSGPISSKYYDVDNITTDASESAWVKVQAIPLNAGKDQVRNFAIGVYFNAGNFGRATCRGAKVGDPVQVGNQASDPCTGNGTKLE